MTDLIISIINFIAGLAIQVFPKTDYMAQLPSNFNSGLETVLKWLRMINFIVPLNDIIKIITFVIAITLSGFLLFVLNWIIRRIFDAIP